MYTRESVSTDRYNGDEAGSGREEAQNTTAVSSDWSVRPSDDTATDTTQINSLSRLNPAATPFSFTGGAGAAAAAGGGPGNSDLVGSAVVSSVSGGLHHQLPGMMANNLDGGMSPTGLPTAGRGHGAGGVNTNGGNSGGGMSMDVGSPNSFGVLQGMMPVPYGMVGGGHRQNSLTGRPVGGVMDFGMLHGGGAAGGGGPMNGSVSGTNPSTGMGGGRVAGIGGGISSPSGFLPPPGEGSDQQELLRLQQTNYRVKMLPPPLTYEVHRKIWSKNEYGDDNDDDLHGSADQEEESMHKLVNEDPIDKEQRLEAYKQIMLRWYSHIHVLESKSEVAKRLVRVRRACPSMEEVIASLSNQQQQQQSGAAGTTTGSEGGDEDASQPQLQQQQIPAAAATTFIRRSPSNPLSMEDILSTWSAQCWDWWQETVKRKPRRARKQGELPLGSIPGMSASTSAPLVAAMGGNGGLGDGQLLHSLSPRAMDLEVSSPHTANNGGSSPYTHLSPYANHPNGNAMEAAGNAAEMPLAPSYTSFTDLSEEAGIDAACRSVGQSSQQQQQQVHTSSYSFPQLPGQHQQHSPPPHPQQIPPHAGTPPASAFTTNGIRAVAPRAGNPDDFLENDHLTLAFTTELLKSLEE
ncbi:hypothetical protein ABL78_2517 [Leptomonas seymouri]|uniref:Uncharacterized protein n=1 Tax=Leptomonas seymouri TaxID=5684 RepID=A0A0N1PEA5_LEPSE|nr:hypothetical protein ABL78_2517 [Leptomonas seymouri]|eukprot:KPI88398.1 hypothetical protein ABL78_2517 [Leptomonas seymouri]